MVFIAFIAIGLIILAIGIYLRADFRKLAATGMMAEGAIFENETSHAEHGNFNYPIVRFITKDGKWITEKHKVSTVPAFKAGEKVMVYYDYDNPTHFVINHPRVEAAPKILIAIGSILFVIGVGMFLFDNSLV